MVFALRRRYRQTSQRILLAKPKPSNVRLSSSLPKGSEALLVAREYDNEYLRGGQGEGRVAARTVTLIQMKNFLKSQ